MSSFRHRLEYGAYRSVKALLRPLPTTWARRIGRGIGSVAHALDGRHREIARNNVALALPALDPNERRHLVRRCFQHFGMALCDALCAASLTPEELCDRVDLEGWEHLVEAERSGHGVFLLSAHLGVWEVAAYPAGLFGGPMHVVGRPPNNPYMAKEIVRVRERHGNRMIAKRGAVRQMLKVLADGGRLGILVDQRVQPKEGVKVPFFGQPSWTTPVLARISLRTGAPVVPYFGLPAERGRYRIIARQAIWPSEVDDLEGEDAIRRLTERYLEATEAEIRKHPEQWLWMHRRWRGD